MDRDGDKQQQTEAAVERELRQARKFSPQEAMARMAGPGAMKGASPVSRLQQAETEIGTWLKCNVQDVAGALQATLHRQLKGSERLVAHPEQPLLSLSGLCRDVLASDYLLEEVVRECDAEWGLRMDERPYFNRVGAPSHPADPYTIESVRRALADIVTRLADPSV
jgi:hypothetical protein